ncbi:DNA repair protein RadC [Yersinia intermedia]|uniref:RadC family protein n=1 Tax=Yersinia intermedia TaxID=631 RepID=UPI0022FEE3EF|nr:DNA repair protein RadC [Yersinia intermedia]MDA5479705.1 DNA repair protein RadC [Yersinia intermedia]
MSAQVITLRDNADEEWILRQAHDIIERRFIRGSQLLSVNDSRQYFVTQLAMLEHEVFGCLLLDNQHRVLAYQELFRGTFNAVHIHPREVAKLALKYNAAAIIAVHNHPSGEPEPSQCDKHITQRLKSALDLIDVRLLDHFIVAGTQTVSMAERGLL